MINTNDDIILKIVFSFNEEAELNNWYDTCTREVKAGLSDGSRKWGLGDIPVEIPEIISRGKNREDAIEKIKPKFYEFINSPEAKQILTHFMELAQKNWGRRRAGYFESLSKMLEIPISEFEKEYQAYFTFSQRCPFGSTNFMFNKYGDISNTAAHEIMHIELLKKYNKYLEERGLTDEQIYHFKEILTVLLNEDMKDIMYRPDRGYGDHQELREKTLKLYQECKKTNEPFLSFLDKAIEILKTRY